MKRPSYRCVSCGGWHVLAMVTPAGAGEWQCHPCAAAAAAPTPAIPADVRDRVATYSRLRAAA